MIKDVSKGYQKRLLSEIQFVVTNSFQWNNGATVSPTEKLGIIRDLFDGEILEDIIKRRGK